jgi:hypothetical protein
MVVEIPSGKVGARHRGSGAGLSVYGMAVGALVWALRSTVIGPSRADLWLVEENTWTRSVPKGERLGLLRVQFPEYEEMAAAGGDPWGDAGDALGLAVWFSGWLEREAAGCATVDGVQRMLGVCESGPNLAGVPCARTGRR